jgi:hypothetical protein
MGVAAAPLFLLLLQAQREASEDFSGCAFLFAALSSCCLVQ